MSGNENRKRRRAAERASEKRRAAERKSTGNNQARQAQSNAPGPSYTPGRVWPEMSGPSGTGVMRTAAGQFIPVFVCPECRLWTSNSLLMMLGGGSNIESTFNTQRCDHCNKIIPVPDGTYTLSWRVIKQVVSEPETFGPVMSAAKQIVQQHAAGQITAEQAETLLTQEMRDLLKVDTKERTLLGSITPFLVVVNLVLQILSGIGFDVPDILGTDLDSELLDIEDTTPDSPAPPSPPEP